MNQFKSEATKLRPSVFFFKLLDSIHSLCHWLDKQKGALLAWNTTSESIMTLNTTLHTFIPLMGNLG